MCRYVQIPYVQKPYVQKPYVQKPYMQKYVAAMYISAPCRDRSSEGCMILLGLSLLNICHIGLSQRDPIRSAFSKWVNPDIRNLKATVSPLRNKEECIAYVSLAEP